MKTTTSFRIGFLFIILLLSSNAALFAFQTSENNDFLYAKRLYDDGMLDLAAKQFRAFMENYPTSPRAPEALFMTGEAYFKAENFEEARQAYLEMTVRFPRAPKNDEAQYRIGDCFKAQNKFEDAAQAYQRVKVFYPHSPLAAAGIIDAGEMFTKAGIFDRALSMYFSFQEDYPEDPKLATVRLAIIKVLMQKNELQRALAEADKLLAFAGGSTKNEAKYQRGRILEEMGRLDEAQTGYLELNKLTTISEDLKAKVLIRLGYLYRLKGEWARSNEFFLQALATKGELTTQLETTMLLGNNYFELENFAQALEYYQKAGSQAAKNEAHYFKALFQSALCYESLADYKNANDLFFRLQEILPENLPHSESFREKSYLHIAQNYLALNDGFAAVSYFQKFLSLYPESKTRDQIQLKIAQIYEKQLRDPDKALRLYERFVELFPQSAYIDDAQLGAARCLVATENYAKAINALENYLSTYPSGMDYAWARQELTRLKNYYLKNIEKSVSLLSKLVGVSLTSQSNANNFLALADLNFEQLRDYRQALTYYQEALNLGAGFGVKDQMYFRMGQSYLRLASFEGTDAAGSSRAALADSARRIFRLVATNYTDGAWADDAAIALAEMRGPENEADLIENLISFPLIYPDSDRKDYVLLFIGNRMSAAPAGAFPDSLKTPDFYYQSLITQFGESALACEARFKKGEYLYRIGNLSAAQQSLQNYFDQCAQDENRVQANYLMAEILRLQQNYEQSISHYRKIITNYFYSDYADSAQLKIGDVLLENNEYQAALNHLLAVQDQHSQLGLSTFDKKRATLFSKDEFEYKIALAYEKLGDYQNAKLRYQNYLKIAPNGVYVARVLLALGRITSISDNADADIALSYFDRLKTSSNDNELNYSASIQSADLLFQEEKYAEARKEYLRALTFTADDTQKEYPQAQSIICQFRLKEIAVAENEAEAFEKQFGNIPKYSVQFEVEKGQYYLDKKFYEKAENVFSDIRKKYKQTEFAAQAELALGIIYIRTNKDEKALDIISQIPEKYPDSEVAPRALVNLGDYYLGQTKQPMNAISVYQKALEHPKIGKLYDRTVNNLIRSYDMVGMYDQLLILLRNELKRNPEPEVAYNLKLKVGITYKALKQYDLAIAQLEDLKRVSGAEDEAEVQYNIAECYDEMGQYERAITEYLKVKYISKQTKGLPWDVSAQFKAGQVYVKLKQYDEAENLFNKIVRSQGAQSDFGRHAVLQIEKVKQMRAEGN